MREVTRAPGSAVKMKMAAVWGAVQCDPAEAVGRFIDAYRLHHRADE